MLSKDLSIVSFNCFSKRKALIALPGIPRIKVSVDTANSYVILPLLLVDAMLFRE